MVHLNEETINEAIAATLTTNVKFIKDFPPGNEFAAQANLCSELFSCAVNLLQSFNNNYVGNLASYAWDLFHNHHAMMAFGPNVPSLSVSIKISNEGKRSLVIPPKNWPDMIAKDSVFQLGAVIYVSSQVIDAYNDKLEDAPKRAASYESEYLLSLKNTGFNQFNEYQRGIIRDFPNGIEKSLLYVRRPVIVMN